MRSVLVLLEFPDAETERLAASRYRQKGCETGSIDFNKIKPVPEELMILNSEEEIRSAYNVYFSAINPKMPNYGYDKMSQDEYDELFDRVFKQQGTIPIIDNLPYDFLIRKSEEFEQQHEFPAQGYFDDIMLLGKTAIENIQKYGCPTYVRWRAENWGTHSPAHSFYEINNFGNGILFKTDVFPPSKICEEMSRQMKDIEIKMSYIVFFDEDPKWVGINTYLNGIETKTPENEINKKEVVDRILNIENDREVCR